jgi:hypothetical protein
VIRDWAEADPTSESSPYLSFIRVIRSSCAIRDYDFIRAIRPSCATRDLDFIRVIRSSCVIRDYGSISTWEYPYRGVGKSPD